MLYKPNYCCNCGEKIERIDWNALTSRRFCEVCSAELKRYDFLPRAAIAGGILALMFGLGSLFGGKTEGNPPAQTLSASPARLKSEPERPPVQNPSPEIARPQAVPSAEPAKAQIETPAASAKIHYCGALTKKGTPCSRKVKSPGARCYQHEGKPAAGSSPTVY